MAKLPVPVSHRLRFSYGKDPEDAYLRDLRGLRVFQREGTMASFLGSHSLLREKVEPIRSCVSTRFLLEALLVCFFTQSNIWIRTLYVHCCLLKGEVLTWDVLLLIKILQ